MDVIVLGSAAGGGFPQWNCGCNQCRAVRQGAPGYLARTQDSLAVSAGGAWFLINASPDVGVQLARHEALWPKAARGSPIAGVVLTNGDLDHTLGLFSLREWHPLVVYATDRVRAGLEQNAMLRSLQRFPGQLVWRTLELERTAELTTAAGEASGLRLEAFAAPGNPPLHLKENLVPSAEDNVGLTLVGPSGKRVVYASSTAAVEPLRGRFEACDLLLLDGTFWSDDEPLAFDATRQARAMGHIPISGADGSLLLLANAPISTRVYTHLNNTNPILAAGSAERRAVADAGWRVAEDGMHFAL